MPMMLSRVDLPAPDGPMIEMNSRGAMSALMRRSTYERPAAVSNDFSTLRREMSGPVKGTGSFAAAGRLLVKNAMGKLSENDYGKLAQAMQRLGATKMVAPL